MLKRITNAWDRHRRWRAMMVLYQARCEDTGDGHECPPVPAVPHEVCIEGRGLVWVWLNGERPGLHMPLTGKIDGGVLRLYLHGHPLDWGLWRVRRQGSITAAGGGPLEYIEADYFDPKNKEN